MDIRGVVVAVVVYISIAPWFLFYLGQCIGRPKALNLISCSTLKLCDLIDNRAALINESSCSFVFVVLLIYQMLYAFNFLFAST